MSKTTATSSNGRTPAFDAGNPGSSPGVASKNWGIAQLVEHGSVKSAVVGSIPTPPAKL